MRLGNINKSISVSRGTFTQYSQSYSQLRAINVCHRKTVIGKGKPIVVHAGYVYNQERTTTTKLIFRCQNRS